MGIFNGLRNRNFLSRVQETLQVIATYKTQTKKDFDEITDQLQSCRWAG